MGIPSPSSWFLYPLMCFLLLQRCQHWWLWESEPRVRSPSPVPRWWDVPTSLPRLLWVGNTFLHTLTLCLSSIIPAALTKKSNLTSRPVLRCWWKLCQLWVLSADGQPATSTPLRMKWQLLWRREVRLPVCDTWHFLLSLFHLKYWCGLYFTPY